MPNAFCVGKKQKNSQAHTEVLLLLLKSLKLLWTRQKGPLSAISIEVKGWLLLLLHSDVQTEKMLYNKAQAKEIPCLCYKSLNH